MKSVTELNTEEYFVNLWQEFLRGYKHERQAALLLAASHSTSAPGYYANIINDMVDYNIPKFTLDYTHLRDFVNNSDKKYAHLIKQVEEDPDSALVHLTKAVVGILREEHKSYVRGNEAFLNFRASISNYEIRKELPDINVHDIGHMREIEGFVVQREPRRAYTAIAVYECEKKHTNVVRAENFNVKEPRKCDFCKNTKLHLNYGESTLIDIQEIKIQQRVDRSEPGKIPKPMRIYITNPNLIDTVEGGDYCVCTGIIRAMHMGRNASGGKTAIADYYMDVSFVEHRTDEYILETDSEIEQRVRKFIRPDHEDEDFELIQHSFAPTLYGNDAIKETLMLTVVGSDSMKINNKRHRGELQVLWLSSPSGGKTTGAEYTFQIPPRVQWISPLVTQVGLTASVNTDEGVAVLEAGAYLLASSDLGGLVIADEIQNYDTKALTVLSSVMDDRQRINVNKKNVTADIQVNCASLHMANPKGSGSSEDNFWDRSKNIYQNTGLPGWLLSRYDLIFISDDSDDLELNRAKVAHFNAQFEFAIPEYKLKEAHRDPSITRKAVSRKKMLYKGREIYTEREIRQWITYVRHNFHPDIWDSPEVMEMLEDYYIEVLENAEQFRRTAGMAFKRVTMRDYGALVRLVCAIARAHCRNDILEKDAEQAIELMRASIASSGYNPLLGQEAIAGAEDYEDDIVQEVPIRGDSAAIQKLKESSLKKQRVAFLKIIEKQGISPCEACGGLGHYRDTRQVCVGCRGAQVVTLPLAMYGVVDEAKLRGKIEDVHATGMWNEMIKRGFVIQNTNYSLAGYYSLTHDGIDLVVNRNDKEAAARYKFYHIYGDEDDGGGLSIRQASQLLDKAIDVNRKIFSDSS